MKIENEIEKLVKRVSLIETQNSRFRTLLDSALELTQHSPSGTNIKQNENEFLRETIKLIEDEKARMQEDLDLLSSTESEGVFYYVKHLENDSLEVRKKVDLLLTLVQKQTTEIDQLKIEHMEFKFLLTQPNSNTEWLKSIIRIDKNLSGGEGATLMEERFRLQRKIVHFEHTKTELLSVIENIDKQKQAETEYPAVSMKSDLEQALFKAIDDVAKKKYHDLHLKVLSLEKERTQLLNDLQTVLDQSRKEIADEYTNLQKKILEIEAERAELQISLKENEELKKQFRQKIASNEAEKLAIDKILNAFSNKRPHGKPAHHRRQGRAVRYNAHSTFGLPTCNIL